MKNIYNFFVFFLVVAFASCQNDINDINDINDGKTDSGEIIITNGVIQSPKWLKNTIDSIAHLYKPSSETGEYLYPWVYSVKHKDQEYVYILDGLNSCAVCGNLFFTLSGELIDGFSDNPKASLYYDLATEEDRTLLWGYKYNFQGTKAPVSTAYVYTPNGSLVSDTYNCSEDQTSLDKIDLRNRMATQYPQATVVAESTTTYNCHAYAWHMTEGGSPVWMGWSTNPTSIYRTDGSYIVTSSAPTKVVYLSDNHSAVTTSTTDVFISKWGAWPLVRHNKNYGPYNSSQLLYVKKNDIPPVYIGKNVNDYSGGGSTIYASGGYAGITLKAFAYNATPTSYVWSATFSGTCDRWYMWPSGSSADVSVYFNSGDSGGLVRLECKMYNGSTLIGTATYYLSVYQ